MKPPDLSVSIRRFGFGLAGAKPAMAGRAKWWKLSSALAIGSYAAVACTLIGLKRRSVPAPASRACTFARNPTRHEVVQTGLTAICGAMGGYRAAIHYMARRWNGITAWIGCGSAPSRR